MRFINDFVDVYSYDEEKIFLCSDLPYSPHHTELLFDCYGISHLLTIRPAESTTRDINLPTATCLHFELDDGFEKDDLVLYSERIVDFIKSGITQGTGVLIHSFDESHIQFAFAAYLLSTKQMTVIEAFQTAVRVRNSDPEGSSEEDQTYVKTRLQVLKDCRFKIKIENPRVAEFMKDRSKL